MKLNDRQKEAVEYLDGPLLVLAGPGTGKTQLLSEKVAYILRETDTNPENILCMTFTESGAMNMRERLKSIVGKDGLKVNIGTYHAFGTEILAQYKNYAVDYDRRLASPIDEVRQYKIVKEIRDGLPAKDMLRGDNVKDIISVISSAKSAGLSASDLKTVAEQNIEDAEVLSKAISPLLEEIVPRNFEASYKNAYEPIYNILSNYIETKPIIK
jgi:DNA helicase-2/ATP-dependent DNA helicase PcrA